MTTHQQNQVKVIDQIEQQIKGNSLDFSTVSPVEDFVSDPRICLTYVHLPKDELKAVIQKSIIEPLKLVSPEPFYYPPESLHITIKNIRVINDPPNFTPEDTKTAKDVLSKVIPKHQKFKVYFYKLLLFPNNLALMGTTDPELDEIILDLDKQLKDKGVPDDKKYINSQYFICNMTLARFGGVSQEFKDKVQELSKSISIKPYTIDSVNLVTCNAVFKNLQVIDTLELS